MKNIKFFILIICLFAGNFGFAQNTTVYQCSFEDNEDISAWDLQTFGYYPTDFNLTGNNFYIGYAASISGSKSLYVSTEGTNSNIIIVPRATVLNTIADLSIELPQGDYILSFDYNTGGNRISLFVDFLINRLDEENITNGIIIYNEEEGLRTANIEFSISETYYWVSFFAGVVGGGNPQGVTQNGIVIDNIVIQKKPTPHTIASYSDGNGVVTPSQATATSGETVTLTVTPVEGYELNTIIVYKEGGGVVDVVENQFVMPNSNVIVASTFRQVPSAVEQIYQSNVLVFSHNRAVTVQNAESAVQIFDICGRTVAQGAGNGEYAVQQSGIYLVKVGSETKKVVVQ